MSPPAPTLAMGKPGVTTGPSLLLPRQSVSQRIAAPAWPLLASAAGRQHLVARLREALLIEQAEALPGGAQGDAAVPPALFLARLLAETAVVLQRVAGHPVALCEAGALGPGDAGLATWEYLLAPTGRAAGEAAAELLTAAAEGDVSFERASELVERVCSAVGNGVVEVVLEAAYRRGLPFRVVDPVWPVHAFGQGSAMRRLMTSISESQGHISTIFTKDKVFSLRILREAGFPVPLHRLVRSESEAVAVAEALGYPVVVKPSDLLRSKGVSVNLQSAEAVRLAFREARAHSNAILVENHLAGLPYRILVLGGRACAAMRRSVPMVTGDGVSDVQGLIDKTNRARARALLKSASAPRKINIANFRDELGRCLAEQGLSLQSVPPAGREVQLAFMAQTGRGGENLDVTAAIHPDNLAMAEAVARVLEMPTLGLDFMTDDIARSWKEGHCGINEVNAEPAFSLHQRATSAPRDVVTPYLDQVFGPACSGPVGPGQIPIVCLLGGTDTTVFARLECALAALGQRSGLAGGDDHAQVGRFRLPATRLARRPADRLLADARVDWALVDLTAADFSSGLAFERCTACYLTLPPRRPLAAGDALVKQARLMAHAIACTLILPHADHAFWRQHLDLSRCRVILLAPQGGAAAVDGSAVECLELGGERGGDLRHHHSGRAERLLALDSGAPLPASDAEALVLAAAALLAAGRHPRDVAAALDMTVDRPQQKQEAS